MIEREGQAGAIFSPELRDEIALTLEHACEIPSFTARRLTDEIESLVGRDTACSAQE